MQETTGGKKTTANTATTVNVMEEKNAQDTVMRQIWNGTTRKKNKTTQFSLTNKDL